MNIIKKLHIFFFALFLNGCNSEVSQLQNKKFPMELHNDNVESISIYKLNKDTKYDGLFDVKDKETLPIKKISDPLKAQQIYDQLIDIYGEHGAFLKTTSKEVPLYLIYFHESKNSSLGRNLGFWIYGDFFRIAIQPQVKISGKWHTSFKLLAQQSNEISELFSLPKGFGHSTDIK